MVKATWSYGKSVLYTDTGSTDDTETWSYGGSYVVLDLILSKIYSRGDYSSLPTDDSDLSTIFSSTDYTNVESDDNVYVNESAYGGDYAIFEFKDKSDDTTYGISVTWKGKSDRAPSLSTVYLQIYNRTTSSWETLDSNSTASANTEFTLSGSKTSNLSDYYDSNGYVACRVYQRAS